MLYTARSSANAEARPGFVLSSAERVLALLWGVPLPSFSFCVHRTSDLRDILPEDQFYSCVFLLSVGFIYNIPYSSSIHLPQYYCDAYNQSSTGRSVLIVQVPDVRSYRHLTDM